MTVEQTKLCRFVDLIDGQAKGFDVDGTGRDTLFVVRQGGEFYAWMNSCPHQGYEGTSMPWRKDQYLTRESNNIRCSGHGAQFDVRTGVCVFGPCQGLALTPAQVVLNGSGQLIYQPNRATANK